jgi:hypothetical protein
MTKAPVETLGVVEFARAMAARHPELANQVTWREFKTICAREGISFRVLDLSRPARLLRLGNRVGIQLNRSLDYTRRTREGMHELCHHWRDDLGESCLYSDDDTLQQPREDFAETFAWYITSPARIFLDHRRIRPLAEDLRYILGAGIATVPQLAAATSQPDRRVIAWAQGASKPDAVTAQVLRRLVIALKK